MRRQKETYSVSGGISYLWNTGEVSDSITVDKIGDYSVTVTDINGCKGEALKTLDVRSLPTALISGESEICMGSTATLKGEGGVIYIWSNNMTSQSIEVNNDGIYSLTVTDSYGCSNQTSRSLMVNSLPVISISGEEEICVNSETKFSAGGGSVYLWSNHETTQSIVVKMKEFIL